MCFQFMSCQFLLKGDPPRALRAEIVFKTMLFYLYYFHGNDSVDTGRNLARGLIPVEIHQE